VAKATEDAIQILRKLTASVEDVRLPQPPNLLPTLTADAYAYHAQWITKTPEQYQPTTRAAIQRAADVRGPVYADTRRELDRMRREIKKTFTHVDFLITPTSLEPPATIEEVSTRTVSARNTLPFNIFGIPTIDVPCGFTDSGLPVGFEISAPPFAEPAVLALAHASSKPPNGTAGGRHWITQHKSAHETPHFEFRARHRDCRGREGWAEFFLRQGYAVYVVDQPGRGRAAYEAETYGPMTQLDAENIQRRFVAPERYNLWPQAHLHTQWPGKGAPGDTAFDQFYSSQVPSIQNFTLQQLLNRDAILALLDKIGPAILLTHSQSGAFGWPVADARPSMVKAIVALEPNGPPFFDVENIAAPDWFRDAAAQARPWGVTAAPLTYSPPAAKASDLAIERQQKADAPGFTRCWMQIAPARTLPNLQKLPIPMVTAEASYHAAYDHCTVKYLEQAGVHPVWIKLGDTGIHGNGHMMMLEKNNLEIAGVLARWLAQNVR
jgi:pimeloyl-ACP methyl ester carboxylesterase